MSLVPIHKDLVGTEVSVGAIAITCILCLVTVAGGTLTCWIWFCIKACGRGKTTTKQLTLPSGVVVSYGGPSAQ